MKISTFTSILLVSFCCSSSTFASEYEFVAEDNSSNTNICVAAATDNKEVLIKKLNQLRLSGTTLPFRSVVNSIRCNNQYVGNFAKTYNALNTSAYLDKYTNKRNRKLQANITIRDIASVQSNDKQNPIIVVVASN